MERRIIHTLILIPMIGFLTVVVSAVSWVSSVPIRIEQHYGMISFDLRTLDEYGTDVRDIRLHEVDTGKLIWHMRGSGTIHHFDLYFKVYNPGVPEGLDGLNLIYAEGADTFTMNVGVEYELVVIDADQQRGTKRFEF